MLRDFHRQNRGLDNSLESHLAFLRFISFSTHSHSVLRLNHQSTNEYSPHFPSMTNHQNKLIYYQMKLYYLIHLSMTPNETQWSIIKKLKYLNPILKLLSLDYFLNIEFFSHFF